MTKTIIILIIASCIALFFVAVGWIANDTFKPTPQVQQPEPINEAIEVPGIPIEAPAIVTEQPNKPTEQVDTPLTDQDGNEILTAESKQSSAKQKQSDKTATFPFYFEREGASFQMDISYRYADEKFRFENFVFRAPKPQTIYRDRFFRFGSGIGYLTDSGGNGKLLLQPLNFRFWKVTISPTLMVDPEYRISYGGTITVWW